MASRFPNAEEHDHRPARSGTPAAWMALALMGLLVAGWMFFGSIVCGTLRLGLAAVAWNQRAELSMDHLALTKNGTILARGITVSFGASDQRSSWKSDSVEVRLSSLGKLLGFSKTKQTHLIEEVMLGKSKVLLDRRGEKQEGSNAQKKPRVSTPLPWAKLLPAALMAGPTDLVVIGENYRISADGLRISLPDRWAGKLLYAEAALDIDPVHQVFPATSAPASWNGTTLRLGKLVLAKDLEIQELTLTPHEERLEFGVKGRVGAGLLRGDGSLGGSAGHNALEVTLVGENLTMESLSTLVRDGDSRATGTIRQGRFTFRGDPAKPLEADSSLRLVADGFRWEGRGWDSLRVAATLTGRVCTLSELSLHQKENDVEAEGESNLPEDWHAALKAPFTATFHAQLEDAGALAALAGSDFAQLSGGLVLEGKIKGAENKAEGYCNLLGSGMKIRNLPVDWLKGCLLFQGEKTKLSYLEAWSRDDRVEMQGTIGNSGPHTYTATADFDVVNLTKRLAELGVSTASQMGGGAVQGTWKGNGSAAGHSGTFSAKVSKWISPWTEAGMSGSFEGAYAPGRLSFSKAEFQRQDLRLGLQLEASSTRLEAKSIVATRNGKTDPLVQGNIALPVNALALWQTGELVSNLGLTDPLSLHLDLHGIKAEELADLLGQHIPCTGSLEGVMNAGGTLQSPEIHSTLTVSHLTLPEVSGETGLTWAFDSSGGRATSSLVQNPAKNSPLMLQAEMPCRLRADKGVLSLAETTAPIHVSATFHHVPLTRWIALLGGSSRGIHEGTLDGSLTLGGTLDKPSAEGNLLVEADTLGIPGKSILSMLKLPITLASNKATLTGGTALYGATPSAETKEPDQKSLALSGAADWQKIPWEGHLDMAGKDLPLPGMGDLACSGDATISLRFKGTNPPVLAGNLLFTKISGTLPSILTPYFTPPGFISAGAPLIFESTSGDAPWGQVQLDLGAKTAGTLPLAGAGGSKLQWDLHLKGPLGTPFWTGKIIAQNDTIDLPSGPFVIPEAILQNEEQGQSQLRFKAFGMTRQGFCLIAQEGETETAPWLEAVPVNRGETAADVVLALATPQTPGRSASLLRQVCYWLRQENLFPVPPVGWITRREGNQEQGSLGFYGAAWSMGLLRPAAETTSLQEQQGIPKN